MHIQAEAEDRSRMALWDGGRVIKDEPEDDEEEFVVKSESEYEVGSEEEEEEEEVEAKQIAFQVPESSKRKRLSRAKLKEAKAKTRSKGRVVERWSVERYEMAEQSMLEILKSEGATFEKPITRAALRVAARKHIGDTGLLDHLLKHIEGKTAPGGTERFRRWFNKKGVMEYWLEDANLLQLRAQAHVRDPYWLPTSNDQRTTHLEDLFKDMLNWKAQTDQNLKLILTSWKAMQDMYSELMAWKAKLEPQLVGFKSVLNSLQASKPLAAEDRWEDWLDSTNLDDLYSSLLPLPPNNATNRDIRVRDVAPDHLNVTPDSSTTANSMPDFHNSSCQELFVDLFNWKAKMEETVTEISNRINMIRQGQA